MPNPSISAPPPRSYRLRRHFPRHCDVTTRVLHPYKPRFLRKEGTAGSPAAAPSSRHFTARYRNCSCPAFSHGHTPSASRLVSGILRRRAGRRTRTSCAGRSPAATDSPPGRKTSPWPQGCGRRRRCGCADLRGGGESRKRVWMLRAYARGKRPDRSSSCTGR